MRMKEGISNQGNKENGKHTCESEKYKTGSVSVNASISGSVREMVGGGKGNECRQCDLHCQSPTRLKSTKRIRSKR